MGVAIEVPSVSNSLAQYRKKVEHFIKTHEDQITIQKLKRNEPITESDLAVLDELLFEASSMQSRQEYNKAFSGGKPLGRFVRELIGLDRAAAKKAFADFLDEAKYNSRQIDFINEIINFLTINGVMESGLLFQPPFTDMHEDSAYGYYADSQVLQLVATIDSINSNIIPRHNAGVNA